MHAWLMQGMHAMSGEAAGGVAHVAELGKETIPRLHGSHISGQDLMARSPGELVAVAARLLRLSTEINSPDINV